MQLNMNTGETDQQTISRCSTSPGTTQVAKRGRRRLDDEETQAVVRRLCWLISKQKVVWMIVGAGSTNHGLHQCTRVAWAEISLNMGGDGSDKDVAKWRKIFKRKRDQYNGEYLRGTRPDFQYAEEMKFLDGILTRHTPKSKVNDITFKDFVDSTMHKFDYKTELNNSHEFIQRCMRHLEDIFTMMESHSKEALRETLRDGVHALLDLREVEALAGILEPKELIAELKPAQAIVDLPPHLAVIRPVDQIVCNAQTTPTQPRKDLSINSEDRKGPIELNILKSDNIHPGPSNEKNNPDKSTSKQHRRRKGHLDVVHDGSKQPVPKQRKIPRDIEFSPKCLSPKTPRCVLKDKNDKVQSSDKFGIVGLFGHLVNVAQQEFLANGHQDFDLAACYDMDGDKKEAAKIRRELVGI
uniref:MADF domain-containing protein n=1 Tax=Heterorhabditis bacteriophora TaxID=37862 RepID=A0A1I7XM27_HETBA